MLSQIARSVREKAKSAVLRFSAVAEARTSGLSSILDRDDGLSHVSAHDKYGFTVNGILMRGSVLVFRHFTLLWNVQSALHVSPRSLAIAHMVKPRPELLIIGTGDSVAQVNPALFGYFSRKGISVEPLPTVRRCPADL